MLTCNPHYTPGQQITYYPRQGKPGHVVTIVEVRPHPFHRAIVRFRYQDGRIRDMTIARFYTEPD